MSAHLIIVQANGPSPFTFTDFENQNDASNYLIARGDRLSWVVFQEAKQIGYRIDFNKNGTPFDVSSIVVPRGGLAPQHTVLANSATHGFGYTVTLSDLTQDDPQVEPYDAQLLKVLNVASPPTVVIAVSIVNNRLSIDIPGPYMALSFVYWQGCPNNSALAATLAVDFPTAAPFVDASGNDHPLDHRTNGTTYTEQIAAGAHGQSFNYTITMGGISQQFVFAVQ